MQVIHDVEARVGGGPIHGGNGAEANEALPVLQGTANIDDAISRGDESELAALVMAIHNCARITRLERLEGRIPFYSLGNHFPGRSGAALRAQSSAPFFQM